MTLPVRRSYVGAAVQCTLTSAITGASSSISLTGDTTAWNDTANGPFYIVVDPGLASEEKILVGSRSTSTLSSLTRGVDGTSAQSHSAGAIVYPIFTAVDADEANKLASTMTTKGDLLVTDGSTPNRLAVGSNNQFLVADSAATNGVKWTGTLSGATVALGSNTVSGTKAEFDTAVTDDNFAYVGTANTFTTNQVISASSSSDLLRITQTGSGNALLVEDDTNPDSTPTIIDAVGRVIVGHTAVVTVAGVNPPFQVHGAGSTAFFNRYSANNSGADVRFGKSRSTSAGSFATVNTGDALGTLGSYADDGTSFVLAGSLAWTAEGTVSTGVVPSRLTFSTASSAGTNTERMRIDSAGQVGIGGTPTAGRNLTISKTITGGAGGASFGVVMNGVAQSDVTASAQGIRSAIGTAAASFTLPIAYHFFATQGTFGAGSTVTTQAGYTVDSGMTGATNNYGFYGTLPTATGRFNLYMEGTAANYMAGRLGVGATLTSGAMAQVTNTTAADKAFVVKGAASQSGTLFEVQNSAATPLLVIASDGTTSIGATTPLALFHLLAGTATGVSPGTGGRMFIDGNNANNWIDIAAATTSEVGLRFGDSGGIQRGRVAYSNTNDALDFYTAGSERMRIDSAGAVSIGSTQAATSLNLTKNISGSTNSQALRIASPVATGVTGEARYISIVPSVDASVAVGNLVGTKVFGATLGASASITTQYGFWAASDITAATTNYGFYGDIASGTGRWNLYMNGTAANYMAGNVCVGTTSQATSADKAIHMGNGTAPTASITGGVLYVEAGALKYRGSSGTITTIANA